MATHGPDRSGSGPGVPVPKSTTLVIGDVLYAESGRAVPVVIKSDAAATTNGRGHPARRFVTMSCLPTGFTRVNSIQQNGASVRSSSSTVALRALAFQHSHIGRTNCEVSRGREVHRTIWVT